MGRFEETIDRIQERIILNEKLKGMEGNIIGVSVEDVNIILQELENTKADLYEANKRIVDLLLILGDRDRIIDLMARAIDNYDSQLEICQYKNKEDVIKAFEVFENMINIRKKKREESKNAKD